VRHSLDSSEFQTGARLGGVRRILDSLQNHSSWKVISVDAGESRSGLSATQFEPISLTDPKVQESVLKAKSAWDQIAHERVKERLRIMFFSCFWSVSYSRADVYRAYSEQASR
jgi:hypothetical protein